MKKNKEQKSRKTDGGKTIRERMRDAANGFAERAKKMNSEEKNTAEQEQTVQAEEHNEAAQETQAEERLSAEELAKELAKARAQADEYLDLAQRKQAEFANYRRRTEGVRAEAYDDGRRDAIEKLLPIVDNLERALSAAGEEAGALHEGVQMVLRQTQDALAKMGVEEIDPQGQLFDANLMNAVMQGTEDEGEPGTVCLVLQKGYKLGERVIRHAMVKVVAG